ncbi:MAG: ribonuclease Y [Candidatus Pacebacteria bacterium]|nr:ribonuclease Y [Candidatus Paceibacterota bacterium]
MEQIILILLGMLVLAIGATLGYFTRQSLARRKADVIETKLKNRIDQVKKEAEDIKTKAEEQATQLIDRVKKETEEQRREIFQAERLLLKKENILNEKYSEIEVKEKDFNSRVEKLKAIKANLESLQKESEEKIEKIANLSKEQAKQELLDNIEKQNQKELLEKIRKIEIEGFEKYQEKAKEILALAIQKLALSQAQEITTTTVSLPSDEVKGRIIGKEGRNIKTLEKLTGVEIIVDDTPEAVVISGFDPIRRQVAKNALEKLIRDGRIQPARIEKTVEEAEEQVLSQVKQAGEKAVYDLGIIDFDPKIIQLLGRLYFRTSYGQNALLHSMEVAYLSGILAAELGLNVKIAQRAGLLHDIGKAVDHQIQGSHVDIGIKILEKFNLEKEIIKAMKAHHEEYPAESLEAIIVQTADQISGARPGARKDNLENYIKRLEELEQIANSFEGVEKSYAIQAGRELRVFVNAHEIDDYQLKKMAKEIASRIQEELRYPGEIKVIIIRENRVVEYAR